MAGRPERQSHGTSNGQSFMDRMNAAKYSFTGSGLGKIVCKATTEEIAAPKKKHMEYIVQCTFEPNVSITDLTNHLIVRTQQVNWIIVFKALITIHNTMNYGNERFSQYLSTNNNQLTLTEFNDRTELQAYTMSKFVRQYSKYVTQKIKSYREMGFDFCKIKRGKDNGILRKMSVDKLIKSIPVLELQLDAMLDFEPTYSEMNHPVVYGAFILLYKDAIRLFATYNDGMITLIEKYFSMSRKQCRNALNLYRHFTKKMQRVNKFLKLAEEVGCGDVDGLELQPVPPSVLEALENHLKHIDEGSTPYGSITTSKLNLQTKKLEQSEIGDQELQRIINAERRKLDEFAAQRSNERRMSATTSEPVLSKIEATFLMQPHIAMPAKIPKKEKKPSDDLILLDLDPDPNAIDLKNNVAYETADLFNISKNFSQHSSSTNPFSRGDNLRNPMKPNIGHTNASDFNYDLFDSSSLYSKSAIMESISPDNKLASLAGNLDISSNGSKNPQNCIPSFDWGRSGDSIAPLNWNVSNNPMTMNPYQNATLPSTPNISNNPFYCGLPSAQNTFSAVVNTPSLTLSKPLNSNFK